MYSVNSHALIKYVWLHEQLSNNGEQDAVGFIQCCIAATYLMKGCDMLQNRNSIQAVAQHPSTAPRAAWLILIRSSQLLQCCMAEASCVLAHLHRQQPAVAMHSSKSDQRLATALRKSSARMVHAAWLRGLPPRPFFLGTIGWGPPSAVLEARGSTHLASMLCADSSVKLPHLPPTAKVGDCLIVYLNHQSVRI